MTVHVFEAGLMHVPMGVFGPVGVRVSMLVLDVVVLVCGVGVRMGRAAVPVFVRVWRAVGVLLGHRAIS